MDTFQTFLLKKYHLVITTINKLLFSFSYCKQIIIYLLLLLINYHLVVATVSKLSLSCYYYE